MDSVLGEREKMSSTSTENLPFIWKDALLEFVIVGPLAGALYLLLGASASVFVITMPAALLILGWGLAARRYHYEPGTEDEIPQDFHRRSSDSEGQAAALPTFIDPPQRQLENAVREAPPAQEQPRLNDADKRALVEAVFGDPCPYCGTTINANNAKLDFMDPLSRGGRGEAGNVSVCCNTCESKKSGRSFADWLNSLEEPYLTIAWDLYQSRKRSE